MQCLPTEAEIPHIFQAEAALLGSLLLENSHLAKVASYLLPEHFFEPLHGRIYAAVRTLVERGETANPFTLKAAFSGDIDLRDIGGGRYLLNLADFSDGVVDPEDYALAIVDAAQKRQILAICIEAIDRIKACNIDDKAGEILAKVYSSIDGIVQATPDSHTYTVRQVSERIFTNMQAASPATSTGFKELDDRMDGGLYAGKVYGFAGRKKTGKTIMAGSISHQLNKAGTRHLFICGEMSPEEIHQRNIARELNVFPSSFRSTYRHNPDFQRRVADYAVTVPNNTIYRNAPGLTFDSLRRIVSLATNKHKIQGFILDYWQLVGGKDSRQSLSEHLDAVAQWIADYCRKENIWAIVMAQINQTGNTRGGEGMRLAFDQVYQINREDSTQPDMWLEMMDTRYTAWGNIGSESQAGFYLNERGPYYAEAM